MDGKGLKSRTAEIKFHYSLRYRPVQEMEVAPSSTSYPPRMEDALWTGITNMYMFSGTSTAHNKTE